MNQAWLINNMECGFEQNEIGHMKSIRMFRRLSRKDSVHYHQKENTLELSIDTPKEDRFRVQRNLDSLKSVYLTRGSIT